MGKSFLVILAPECFCYLLKALILSHLVPFVCSLSKLPVFAKPSLSMTLEFHILWKGFFAAPQHWLFSILRLVLFHSYQMQEAEYLESSPYSPPSKTLESSFYLHSSPKFSNVELYKILYLMI